jgi:hypothetical protein
MKKLGAKEIAAAILVVIAIAAVFYAEIPRGPDASSDVSPQVSFTPIKVENPTLRVDKVRASQAVEYSGRHRNIFSETLPPPVLTAAQEAARRGPVGPQAPPPPPPLVVNLKFFGYLDDRSDGTKKAFFTDGDENVFIAAEGDTLQNRFRLLKIRNDSVEMEELASGRRTVVMIEPEPGGTGPIATGGNDGQQR